MATLSEKFATAYGNIRTRLLGSNLTGRRAPAPDNVFKDEAQLTGFKKDKEEGQLKPKVVDLMRTRNRDAHRTNEYEIPNLIIRRGQEFNISITFDRTYINSEDDIILKFVTGSRPLQSKGTVVPVHNVDSFDSTRWGFNITEIDDKTVSLKLFSTADAIVGRYQIFIDTFHKNPNGEVDKFRYKHPDDIYIIFNPWCQDDNVHIEQEDQRLEYVMNETGRIWLGTVGKFHVRPWSFAQFDDVCLMAALALMDKSDLGDKARGNPTYVVRALSRAINNDERDGGVLLGNWSGKYDDGVAPYAWNGSAAILEEFLKKRKGVKYGQCWTFAAVATTLFRALGIPTRCVTNFRSAHDSDYSCPIDSYWTTEGKPHKMLDDAVWDFHVWNESWFRRPDLPVGYDGWQAYDCTPQEVSEGVFTCGPAPVKAIRDGQVHIGYDAMYLYAEIHGDRVHWTVDHEGNMTAVGMEERNTGRYISTKAVAAISREDLTAQYKYQDGSKEEILATENAKKCCLRRLPVIVKQESHDIEFLFNGEGYRTGDISGTLKMKNNSSQSRTVDVYMCAAAAFYTGVAGNELKDTSTSTVIEPLAENNVSLSTKCPEYVNNVETDAHVVMYCMATVKETKQQYMTRETFWLEKPHLDMKTEFSVQVGKPFDLLLKFVNTLQVPLTGGHINVAGPGMNHLPTIKIKKPVNPGEEVRELVQLKFRRIGRKEITANFYSKQLCEITGVTEVNVIENSPI